MRVAVVGAGFAGLMAATRLAEAGQDVVVLEARNRVGGRVWSAELVPGDPRTVVERGAEFVLDGYDLLRATVASLGLALAPTGMTYYVREPRGGAPTTHEAMAAVAAAVAGAARSAPAGATLADVAAPLDVDPAALAAYLARVAVSCACPEHRLAASAVADVAAAFTPLPSWRVAGGNQQVALRLAAGLGDRVRLASPVEAVRWDGAGVRLAGAGGEVTADAAVLAVPLPVARSLVFQPALPAWKTDVWDRTGWGHAAKLHLPLLAPAGTSAVLSVPDRFWTWTATDASESVQPVLHGFAGSAPALAGLDVAAGPRRWAALARGLRPDLDADGTAALLTTWSGDPWARGAYTAPSPDARPGDDDALALAVGPLHFAGEHLAGEFGGYMEGALRTGLRAAGEIAAG